MFRTSSFVLASYGLLNSFDLLISFYSVNERKPNQKFISKEIENNPNKNKYPLVVNTWPFVKATSKAWQILEQTNDRLKSVEAGCTECEMLRCDGTVGFGGSPDESGETTLDALIMDGVRHDAGSVAGLKRVKNAIGVARAVMENTKHTLLVGDGATRFAIDMGFKQEDLHAAESLEKWIKWFKNSCQPNFRINVTPDPAKYCGPYQPTNRFASLEKNYSEIQRYNENVSAKSHDTIGMIVMDSNGDFAVGTSTNGASHKIPGRIGDSPIIGSGAYVDNDIGAACATGDGDTLMKFVPSYQTVESMRNGMSPHEASADAINRIKKMYPNFIGAVIAVDKLGNHGAACHGIPAFQYSFKDGLNSEVKIVEVECI